jgi:transposase
MQELYPNCAGIDVHKRFLVACRLHVDEHGHQHKQIRKFGTMLADLEALRDWLTETSTTHVAIESTGVYWQPVFNVLEEGCTVWVVNAKHVKNVPGRKTDVKDSEWLAQLLRAGLLRPSFIPERQQRELRELVRYRLSLVEERNRVANRIQKVLEDANIKLSSVATDIQGVSAQAMIHALVNGEEDPAVLADLAQKRMRSKLDELERALRGRVREHHRYMLGQLLGHLDFLDGEIEKLEERIEQQVAAMPPFAELVPKLDTIPGINRLVAITLLAEIGVDMSRFASDKHLAAWAGLAPGNDETGGKARASKTRKGNRYVRRIMVQAAHAAARKRECYMRSMYQRIARRRGEGRAAVAVGHALLITVYHVIARGEVYKDLGPDYLEQRNAETRIRYLTRELEKLNVRVTIEQLDEAA